MNTDSRRQGARLGEVTMVHDCMICRREVILIATRNINQPLPEEGAILPHVCDECRTKYLTEGILLINPDNGSLVVLKDEAFEHLINKPIPDGRIAFCDQLMLDKLNEMYGITPAETEGDGMHNGTDGRNGKADGTTSEDVERSSTSV